MSFEVVCQFLKLQLGKNEAKLWSAFLVVGGLEVLFRARAGHQVCGDGGGQIKAYNTRSGANLTSGGGFQVQDAREHVVSGHGR